MEKIEDNSPTDDNDLLLKSSDFQRVLTSIYTRQFESPTDFINKKEVEFFLHELFQIIFVGYYSEKIFSSIAQLNDSLTIFFIKAKQQIEPYLNLRKKSDLSYSVTVDEIILQIKNALPTIYDIIWEDAQAAYHGDPAAESIQEVIMAYPGFYAIAVHRISHLLYQLGIPIFPRILSRFAHEKTGIDIHPGARIGSSFFMDHGTGIVIGGTTQIANNVKIYQGVTLGALSVSKDLAHVKRHPTIEDNVVIYSGATILGGKTIIGKNSIIGGNAWVTSSIPPYSLVYQTNEIKVRNTQIAQDDGSDFII